MDIKLDYLDCWTNQVFIDLDLTVDEKDYKYQTVYSCGVKEDVTIFDEDMNPIFEEDNKELVNAIEQWVEKYLHTPAPKGQKYNTKFDELADNINYEG